MGDRYVLRLFRDYLFHTSLDNSGKQAVDFAHVVETLNKLDAGMIIICNPVLGLPEKILLLGKEGTDLLVVSYAELKQSIQFEFDQI